MVQKRKQHKQAGQTKSSQSDDQQTAPNADSAEVFATKAGLDAALRRIGSIENRLGHLEDVDCPICTQTKLLISLPCNASHKYCKGCLLAYLHDQQLKYRAMLPADQARIKCPICSQLHTVASIHDLIAA